MSITENSKVINSEHGISLSGFVVFNTVSDLLKQGNAYIQQYIDNTVDTSIIIDCKEMKRIDSAGISLLLEWQRQCTNKNKVCRFNSLSEQAQALIEAYQLQSLLSSK